MWAVARARGVPADPEFEVLWAVVVPYPVLVVNGFVSHERASNHLCHNFSVF